MILDCFFNAGALAMDSGKPVLAQMENNSATLRTMNGVMVAIPGKIHKKNIVQLFSFCSNGATDCSGIAQACNSADMDFCELDGCCENINSPCPYP